MALCAHLLITIFTLNCCSLSNHFSSFLKKIFNFEFFCFWCIFKSDLFGVMEVVTKKILPDRFSQVDVYSICISTDRQTQAIERFYSIPFYSILFYSILFYSILFYSILLYSELTFLSFIIFFLINSSK